MWVHDYSLSCSPIFTCMSFLALLSVQWSYLRISHGNIIVLFFWHLQLWGCLPHFVGNQLTSAQIACGLEYQDLSSLLHRQEYQSIKHTQTSSVLVWEYLCLILAGKVTYFPFYSGIPSWIKSEPDFGIQLAIEIMEQIWMSAALPFNIQVSYVISVFFHCRTYLCTQVQNSK